MNEPKSKPPIIEGGPNVEASWVILVGWLSPPGLPIWGYNVVFAVLLIAAAYLWCSTELDEEFVKADEQLPRLIAGGSLLICAFLCRVIVAVKRLAAKLPA